MATQTHQYCIGNGRPVPPLLRAITRDHGGHAYGTWIEAPSKRVLDEILAEWRDEEQRAADQRDAAAQERADREWSELPESERRRRLDRMIAYRGE